MSQSLDRRWGDAIARQIVEGESLHPSEQALVDSLVAQSHPHRAERDLLDGLGDLFDESAPAPALDAKSRAMIDAVLAEVDEPPEPAAVAPSRRARWGVVAVATGLLAAGIAALWWWSGPPRVLERAPQLAPPMAVASAPARLVLQSGEVLIDDRPARRGRVRVRTGSTVQTREGTACIDFDTGGRVCLQPHSRATLGVLEASAAEVPLESEGEGEGEVAVEVAVEVKNGRVVASLGTEATRALVLRGGSATVAATTEAVFSLDVSDDAVTLDAIRGRLELPASAAAASEGSGGSTGVQAPGRRILGAQGWRDAPVETDRVRDDQRLLDRVVEPAQATARLSIESTPSGANVILDGRWVGRTPLSLMVEPGERSVELEIPGHAPVHEQLAIEHGDEAERRFSLPHSVADTDDGQGQLVIDDEDDLASDTESGTTGGRGARRKGGRSVEALVLDARSRLAAGDYAEAARRYRTLRATHPRSPEARAALVSLGQLYLQRLGRPREALRKFTRYLSGGRGPLSEEARWGRAQALRRLGDRRGEAAAIEAYLEHHGGSARAGTLRSRLATLR